MILATPTQPHSIIGPSYDRPIIRSSRHHRNSNHSNGNMVILPPPRRLTLPMEKAPIPPTRRLSAVTQGRPMSLARRISFGDSLERGAPSSSPTRVPHDDDDDEGESRGVPVHRVGSAAFRDCRDRQDHEDHQDHQEEDEDDDGCDDVSLVVESHESIHRRRRRCDPPVRSHDRSDSIFDMLFLDGPHATSHGSGNDIVTKSCSSSLCVSDSSLAFSSFKNTMQDDDDERERQRDRSDPDSSRHRQRPRQQQHHPCFERKSSQQSRRQSWIISDWDEIEQTAENGSGHLPMDFDDDCCDCDAYNNNDDGDRSLCPRDASDDVFYRMLDDDDFDVFRDEDDDDFDFDNDGRLRRISGASRLHESSCCRKSLHQIMMEEEVSFQRSLVWHSSEKESFE
mmetsp:Transcript_6839/g.14261  ORF Transcript_6839/g.14261 Transcript_6839/m.14261 type:complete len:396 (+) Transcript_6839:93-1280(+)